MNKIFLALLIVILVSGCSQQVIENDEQLINKNFIDMGEDLACIDSFNLQDREFVIHSQQEYQTLSNYKSPSRLCEDFQLPLINFSKYTLLGKFAQGGGCSIDFEKELSIDDLDKKVIYNINVIENGNCEKLGVSINWVLVPQIPADYQVEFKVN